LNDNLISNILDPVNNQDAVTKGYLQTNYTDTTQSDLNLTNAISGLSTVYVPLTTPLDQILAPTANLSIANNKIVDLDDPTDLNDAVNLNYL